MDNVILIKYGELTTKKSNRKFFINTLYNNILYFIFTNNCIRTNFYKRM